MKICELIDAPFDIEITGITDDSRLVQDGFLFVATKGYNVDHYDYIDDAIKKGCVFVVADREVSYDIPHIVVDNINLIYQELCLKYYDICLEDYHFIGITGTDGKTTTASIVKELIDKCAYLGTNGLVVGNESFSTSNTTPCISELYHDLKIVKEHSLSYVSMEVSSEALLHDRVNGLMFDIILYTNITGDHLNIHKTMDNYFACKLKLLSHLKKNGFVVVNGDDSYLKTIQYPNLITFGFSNNNDYVIESVEYGTFTRIVLIYDNNKYVIYSPFKGEYNVYNVVGAFIIGLLLGIDDKVLLEKIHDLKSISGRCEFLTFGQKYDIVLDYAHTIHGIESILDTFSKLPYNRIITITGCAGGREKDKRPIIGKIVMDKSDISIFTMDDPRYENVDDIINQMVGNETNYIRIIDRQEAIHYGLEIAKEGDVVLILGKGRDNYMAIAGEKVDYCDYDVVCNYFNDK